MKIPGLVNVKGWWWWRPPQVNKVRPKRINLKTKDAAVAVQTVFEITSGQRLVAEDPLCLRPLAAAYLRERKEQRRHNAKTSYNTGRVLAAFCGWAGNPRVRLVDKVMLERWKASMRGLSDASVASHMQRVHGFLTWCVERGHVVRDPMAGMRMPCVKSSRVDDFLSIGERDTLLALAHYPSKGQRGKPVMRPVPRDVRMMLWLGFFAGLRPGEMLAMRPEWVRGGMIRVQEVRIGGRVVFRPKDKESRSIPVHPALQQAFEDLSLTQPWVIAPHRKRNPEPPKLRYDPKRTFAALRKHTGIKVTPYILRHTFAAQLVQAGARLAEVASLLGDSLSVTEAHYAGLTRETRGVLERLAPPASAPSGHA